MKSSARDHVPPTVRGGARERVTAARDREDPGYATNSTGVAIAT